MALLVIAAWGRRTIVLLLIKTRSTFTRDALSASEHHLVGRIVDGGDVALSHLAAEAEASLSY